MNMEDSLRALVEKTGKEIEEAFVNAKMKMVNVSDKSEFSTICSDYMSKDNWHSFLDFLLDNKDFLECRDLWADEQATYETLCENIDKLLSTKNLLDKMAQFKSYPDDTEYQTFVLLVQDLIDRNII